MSFFDSRTGAKITGDSSNSFAGHFPHLPDNTQAPAMLKSFTKNEYMGEVTYQVIWKLLEGDFKGAEVKQRITPFEADDNKAQRALNMMMRIMILCDHPTEFDNPPEDSDLAPMKGKIMAIKVGNGIIQGEERTWVREVWKEGQLETMTGTTKVVTSKPAGAQPEKEESAFDRQRKREEAKKTAAPASALDEDIPF